ncbi:ammonium transporter [Thiomonas intermedia]|uniref:ammonium transporter n=1 Tax=Thiomonas intermedia TaxID=926 RepID=UPI0009A54DA5|nr:ammonium transporter [Thiomonas intermedia]
MHHTHAQPARKHRFSAAITLLLASGLPLNATAQSVPATLSTPHIAQAATLNAGDTAWMLASTALVLMMTIPGLALFYAGMVRKKNILGVTMQVFATTVLVTLLWFVAGYSLAFMPGNAFIGDLSRLFLDGVFYSKSSGTVSVSELAPTIPESVYVMFQMTFAIITPALIVGAFAERMKFSAMLIFMGLWSLLVYAPVAHSVWEPSGWLASMGMLDFAGGTVVHINAGAAGLACAIVLGKRQRWGEEPFLPANLAYTMIGAALLWVGWFGFNAGSACAADGRAGMAMLATQIGTAAAAFSWMLTEWTLRGRPTLLGICSGAVAGLVAITPASGFVDPMGAVAVGLISGVVCYWGATGLKRLLGADDALDVFGIHGVGGFAGAVLTGVFAVPTYSGQTASILVQALGASATLAYSFVASYILLKIIDALIGLRVGADEEEAGLDLSQHGERIE